MYFVVAFFYLNIQFWDGEELDQDVPYKVYILDKIVQLLPLAIYLCELLLQDNLLMISAGRIAYIQTN